MSAMTRTHEAVQRVVDVCVAAAILATFFPALIAIGLGRPVLFRQPRPGLHCRAFTLVKFRTMRNVDEHSGLVTDADRLTGLGRILRATSLDELPTLWNVLRGDMSLVGPRPLLMRYLERYSPEQARRHLVRPGVTGLAQVRGRNSLSWEEKLALDVWYVDHRTVWLNLRICALTISKVLRREGIAAADDATMPEFTGGTPENTT